MVSALMLTDRVGWILPEAETSASRFCFLIVSVLTVTPSVRLNLRFAKTIARKEDDDADADQDLLVPTQLLPPKLLLNKAMHTPMTA